MPRVSLNAKALPEDTRRLFGTAQWAKLRALEYHTVRDRLRRAELSCAAIDRQYKLTPNAARSALRAPHEPAELAIAAALGTEPFRLWPTRYLPSGQRRSVQDHAPLVAASQRRKLTGGRS